MNVAVVFAADYSEHLRRLAFRTPVWIVETPENRAAAEDVWSTAVEWPHISVTLFRFDDWRTLLAQIGAVDGVEAIGTPLTDAVRAALSDIGLTRIDETSEGFRARKS